MWVERLKRENRRASTREKLGAGLFQQRNYKKIGKEKKKNKRMHQLGKHVLFREDDVESGKRMEGKEERKGRKEASWARGKVLDHT